MHNPSPKFRIRSLLVLVALVALALGYEVNRRRWATYRDLARYHAEYEEGGLWTGRQCLDNVIEYEQRRRRFVERAEVTKAETCVEHSASSAEEAKRQFQWAEYHAQLKRDYASRW
jgi:hypothetical protein